MAAVNVDQPANNAEPNGLLNRFPSSVCEKFLSYLDLKTRARLRRVSKTDKSIVESVKMKVSVMTFYNKKAILTVKRTYKVKGEDEDVFLLEIKREGPHSWNPPAFAYILKSCDIEVFRLLNPPDDCILADIHDFIEANSLYIESFRCKTYSRNAIIFLKKCLAGQMKVISIKMPYPPKSINGLLYALSVTYSKQFRLIHHHEDSPVPIFMFIKRWVEHANLEESVGRRIISEGHNKSAIEDFMEKIRDEFKRPITDKFSNTFKMAGYMYPNDARFQILFVMEIVKDKSHKLTCVVVPVGTKVEDYDKYTEDSVELVEEDSIQTNEESSDRCEAIDIDNKDESMGFENDCSFIDKSEAP